MLRPLLSKNLPSTVRSLFSSKRNTHYASGSQRLPDIEKEGNTGRSSTLVGNNGRNGSDEGGKVYQGGKSQKTWYTPAVSAMGSKHDDRGSEGSQEEMVPVGQIGVRYEVDWDTKDSVSADTHPAG